MKKLILVALFGSIGLLGCKEKKELEFISNDLSEKKSTVEVVYTQTPYSENEHQAISDYFRSVIKYSGRLEVLLKKAKKDSSKLKEVLPVFCEQTVLEKAIWESVVSNCEVGGYFICTEEVRAFPGAVQKLLSRSNEIVPEDALGSACLGWSNSKGNNS